jgi:hypothetical protein
LQTTMTTAKKTSLDWTIEAGRQERAAEKAAEILEAFGYSIPVDPLEIAAGEGRRLRTRGADLAGAFDGQLEYHRAKGCFLLLFNTKYDRGGGVHHPRTRFSIAHELGHYYVDAHRTHLLGGGAPHGSKGEFVVDNIAEREADAFAAALLLPTKDVRPIVNRGRFSLATVETVAETFHVSRVSAALRAVNLCDFPAAVAGLPAMGRPWFASSKALKAAGCFRRAGHELPSAAAARQLEVFRCGLAEPSQQESKLSEWFHLPQDGRLENVLVTEQYVPISSMGTLLVVISADEEDLFEE